MQIADVTLFHAPNSGGVRTYLDAKRRRLSQLPGITHHLVIPGRRRRETKDCIEIPAPPLPFSDGYRFPLRRSAIVRELVRLAPDIIEAGDPYVPAWAALRAGRQLGVPVVGFYHSDLVRLLANRLGAAALPAIRLYVRLLYRQFDLVLAPSQVMADQLHQCGVDDVTVQPLGVDLNTFNPAHRDPNLRRELGLEEDSRLLIFAGRGAREKNLPVLLRTLEQLGDAYHLLLVGSHMPKRVPDNVTVINRFCDAATVARLLASADALMHAGDQETFGLVVLEAMASGIPVVAVDAGALPELIPPGCGVLARANDPVAMARAVRNLYSGDVRMMGARARRHVEKHHDWDVIIASLCSHYEEVLGMPHRLALEWSHG
ncbi:glycosyltransferase family 4 protein [Mangrovitalea sediminis]|uniref:glycosyltransferase family 4 protein n=1 Tax=Mangrovitalea sediminis TaxID=1982043 RepID=UPI000BE5D7FE|nr:glycosyltransferase family 1 protein [Mangrovitalea sediminis]